MPLKGWKCASWRPFSAEDLVLDDISCRTSLVSELSCMIGRLCVFHHGQREHVVLDRDEPFAIPNKQTRPEKWPGKIQPICLDMVHLLPRSRPVACMPVFCSFWDRLSWKG